MPNQLKILQQTFLASVRKPIKPALILMSGRPGQGKTTLAKKLAAEFKFLHLDIDQFADHFDEWRDMQYQKEIEPKLIDLFLDIARIKLLSGESVIINLCWTHHLIKNEGLRNKIKNLSNTTHASLLVIECVINNHEIWRQRIAQRKFKRDNKKLTEKGWVDFLEQMQVDHKNPLDHFLVNSEETPS